MKIKTIITVIVILFLVIIPVQIVANPLNSNPNAASTNMWTAVGSTAVVDEDHRNKYQVNAGFIEFKGSNTGWITARINLEMTDDTWNKLSVVYKDPDGAGTACKVLVRIYRVKTESPNLGSKELVQKFTSNTIAIKKPAVQHAVTYFAHSWDNYSYAYYIQIDLYRSSTAYNVRLNSIQLMYEWF
jgi:hypothetical protein